METISLKVAGILESAFLTTSNVFSALLLVYLVSRVISYNRGVRAVNDIPGFRVAFHPFALPALIIPTMRGNPGFRFLWEWRKDLYTRFGNDTISLVPFIFGTPVYYSATVDVARQVAASGKGYEKPEDMNRILSMWGMNLIAAKGAVWRRHRRIIGPAFNNKLYAAVWAETLVTYRQMVADEGWTTQSRINVPSIQALIFKLALIIVGKCGFGFTFDWSEPAKTGDSKRSLQEALRIVADAHMINAFAPQWSRYLPIKRLRESFEAKDEVMEFMQSQINIRRADIRAGGVVDETNVFSMLVKASEMEEGKSKLDDSELIGNVYIMLFAGHETTAHTLAATLGFLSIHPELQQELYEQIISVVGHERDPVFDDYTALNKVLAAFLEALRMFPSAYIMGREAVEDTVLQVPNPVGEEGFKTVAVPKGTQVIVDMIGMQYNPRYYDSPFEYRPSRWYNTTIESDAFTAFSIGPRTCIGRKFAAVEAVCFLTMLLRDYVLEPLLSAGETKEKWAERVLDANFVMTLGVKDVPLTFLRRSGKN